MREDASIEVLDRGVCKFDLRHVVHRRHAGANARCSDRLLVAQCADFARRPAPVADRVVVLSHGRAAAVDTPLGLTSRLPNLVVSVRATLARDEIAAYDGVLAVDGEDGRLRVSMTEPEQLVRHLLQIDPALSELQVKAAGLEHAVLRIMKGHQQLSQEVTA